MTRGKQSKKQIEILAPAGSYESFLAAIRSGADAVYAGGPRFGARAFADNFTQEKLLEAIDYAHLHGRKFYLTVNTLLKDSELETLYDYLAPLYQGGLDAVIIQDMGVLRYIREHFPGLSLHASTQMTLTNVEGALFLKEQGAERVVPARELSLDEVREIAGRTGMEIECFVHGALCYCYSGQCLLSSLIGGRSGNRGQCAQPCRLPYTVNGRKEYVLSLKDICTLELIPEMIEAGINSFKIEGRMKKPEYVALVTSMYRKYTDLYLEQGKKGFSVDEKDKEMLMDIYNRGGFSDGYYKQHNGRDMLSLKRPNHAGVAAVKILSQKGRDVTGQALTEIHKGDILELDGPKGNTDTRNNYTFGNGAARGSNVKILVPPGKQYSKGTVLYRLRNQELLDHIQEKYGTGTVQEPISGILSVKVGEPLILTVKKGEASVTVRSEELTEAAKNQPLDQVRLEKQLKKTGNTEFYFENLEIVTEGDIFLPMQRINELRRRGLELLEQELCAGFHREIPEQEQRGEFQKGLFEQERYTKAQKELPESRDSLKNPGQRDGTFSLTVSVESKEQLKAAVESKDVSRIYMDSNISTSFFKDEELLCFREECRKQGKEFFLAMPHIFRQEAVHVFTEGNKAFQAFDFDGVLIRNYESFHYLKEHGFDKTVILDHNLYVFNQEAKLFWKEQGVSSFTAPVELNERELGRLGIEEAELILYGRLPAMVSAQCITKTTKGCTKQSQVVRMYDRYQKELPVRSCCNFCYNVIYHTSILFLADLKESIERLAPAGLRLSFTLENENETARILKICGDIYRRNAQIDCTETDFTRGHFKRGIT